MLVVLLSGSGGSGGKSSPSSSSCNRRVEKKVKGRRRRGRPVTVPLEERWYGLKYIRPRTPPQALRRESKSGSFSFPSPLLALLPHLSFPFPHLSFSPLSLTQPTQHPNHSRLARSPNSEQHRTTKLNTEPNSHPGQQPAPNDATNTRSNDSTTQRNNDRER